ncbi:hypothetical protein SAMD00019534_010800 [Acytostelium subglobosum LB1]|uniref:hypothetical protein n=1 Tax=Acytostelium subglobosum LB1 TaxID=1410327 RepID=UPI0006449220|nr:hypothetical protein SAMD00019534_010800 [Acytostelium subglobosum LB1]GAM17905.1 hypothetical protein SAMD00019534_010800 [Acytostelium subglobosum LB1]|eukprot:XP_012758501.1 hypothetical protein SAMD00019534_010800 [Acytostelium subglobosum LB1]
MSTLSDTLPLASVGLTHIPDSYQNCTYMSDMAAPASPSINPTTTILSLIEGTTLTSLKSGDILADIASSCLQTISHIGDICTPSNELFYAPNKQVPKMPIGDYITRLVQYSPGSKSCFIAALIYMDRMVLETGFILSSYNIHRVILTALLIATKYLDDIFYDNEYYSRLGGINIKEMNQLELDLLNVLGFAASCPQHQFDQYLLAIESSRLRSLVHLNLIPTLQEASVSEGSQSPKTERSKRNFDDMVRG